MLTPDLRDALSRIAADAAQGNADDARMAAMLHVALNADHVDKLAQLERMVRGYTSLLGIQPGSAPSVRLQVRQLVDGVTDGDAADQRMADMLRTLLDIEGAGMLDAYRTMTLRWLAMRIGRVADELRDMTQDGPK